MFTDYRFVIDALDLTTGQSRWVFTSAGLAEANAAFDRLTAVDRYLMVELSELRDGGSTIGQFVVIKQAEKTVDGAVIIRSEPEAIVKTRGDDARLKLLEFGFAAGHR
ncbi:hypothetical protein [Ochrobactrum sp. A-1]|uniref:hypothetical protein n=1 Tax=Ochrobactrum sp. A-1 TaxID=2920940 RepID=UPI001F0A1A45|nr:hypothetical protein [Ochrobactrum sp. A-1]